MPHADYEGLNEKDAQYASSSGFAATRNAIAWMMRDFCESDLSQCVLSSKW
jgi:hypothetical protein